MRGLFLLTMILLSPMLVSAEEGFWLRNTDSESLFVYWTVEGTSAATAAAVLPALPLAPGGAHGVSPGERVKVGWASGQSLVGVFVPWSANPSFRTTLAGGFLLPSEVPAEGTLLIDASSFAAANRGRALEGPFPAWGLTPPRFALDGRVTEWTNLPPLAEWGPGFLPGGRPWPPAWPRPKSLQVILDEGALWVRLTADRPWAFPSGVPVSLAYRRPGAFFEWPLTGSDPTVWAWTDGGEAQAVGRRLIRGPELEARVSWDRITAPGPWLTEPGTWSLLVGEGEGVRTLDLAPGSLGELP